MTYLSFLLIFICPPLVVLALANRKQSQYFTVIIALLCLVALVYTTPWDNYLVANSIWTYSQERVLGTFYYVPFEEYLFFILQTLLTGFWCVFVIKKSRNIKGEYTHKSSSRLINTMLILMFLLSIPLLFTSSTLYIGLILSWSLPVIILQMLVGSKYLVANAQLYLFCVVPPTVYLWFCDYFALANKIWIISDTFTIGWGLGLLPFEEMVFFLVTNIMVFQGILLSHLMQDTILKLSRSQNSCGSHN